MTIRVKTLTPWLLAMMLLFCGPVMAQTDSKTAATSSDQPSPAAKQAKPVPYSQYFIDLCATGTPEEVFAALENGAAVNPEPYRYFNPRKVLSPLETALKYNPDPQVAVLLINAEARIGISSAANTGQSVFNHLIARKDINADYWVPIFKTAIIDEDLLNVLLENAAEKHNRPEIIKLFLDYGAKVNGRGRSVTFQSPLDRAAWAGSDPQNAQILIDAGANLNGLYYEYDPYISATFANHPLVAEAIKNAALGKITRIENGQIEMFDDFISVLRYGDLKTVKAALANNTQHYTDLDSELWPFIYLAGININDGVLAALTSAGMKLDEHRTKELWFYMAAFNDNPAIMKKVIASNPKMDKSHLETLAMGAAINPNPEMLPVILKKLKPSPEFAAKLWAQAMAKNPNPAIIKMLMSSLGDPRLLFGKDQNQNNYLVLDLAAEANRNKNDAVLITLLELWASSPKNNKLPQDMWQMKLQELLNFAIITGAGSEKIATLITNGANASYCIGIENGYTPLLLAAAYNHQAVKPVLEAGAKAGNSNRTGYTPLMEAAQSGPPELIEQLIKAGGRLETVDAYQASSLDMANAYYNKNAIKVLTDKGVVKTRAYDLMNVLISIDTALDTFLKNGDQVTYPESLTQLEQYGYSLAAYDKETAEYLKNITVGYLPVDAPQGQYNSSTRLIWAASPDGGIVLVLDRDEYDIYRLREPNDKELKIISAETAQMGRPFNFENDFYQLCLSGTVEQINQALEAGAAPDKPSAFFGQTPLMVAALNADPKAANLLLSKAPNTAEMVDDFDQTALMYAVNGNRGHFNVVEILTAPNPNINQRNLEGQTALFMAVNNYADNEAERYELIKAMLDKGADPNLGLLDGTTPLYRLLEIGGTQKEALLLIAHGADVKTWPSNRPQSILDMVQNNPQYSVELIEAVKNAAKSNG